MKILLKVLFISILVASCQNNASNTQEETSKTNKSTARVDSAEETVMKLHDEVMAKMGTMKELRQKLNDISQNTDNDTIRYSKAAENLQEAHKEMMNWMRSYKSIEEQKDWDTEQKLEYLEEQKDKMENIRDYTLSSINHARDLITEHQQNSGE